MTPRVLLVEDDPTTRAFLLAASEALPALVDTADSIASALALTTHHAYALWLIDAHLPDGNGTQLLSRLRAMGLATPALAHTAAHARDELDVLVAAGFSLAVSKPLSAEAWRNALRTLLGQQAHPDAATAVVDTSHLPVWDDAIALSAMNGNRAHVDALRTLFLAELATTRVTMSTAFDAGDAATLLATLHKLRASCGFVGAARLDAAARALHAAPASATAMSRFSAALQDTLSSS